ATEITVGPAPLPTALISLSVCVPGKRNEMYYECCKEPYPDVMYTITMCQHTLYYVLNLLIPCLIISGLALLDFILPADSGEKISLGIPVLLSLTVFMLPVADIIPATSQNIIFLLFVFSPPNQVLLLAAQYFASIMVIVGLSVVVTVLRFHHHGPQAGKIKIPFISLMTTLFQICVILLNWCAWLLRIKKLGENIKPLSCKYSYPKHHLSVNSMEMNVLPGHQSSNDNTIYNMMDNLCCPQKNVLGSESGKITCPLPEDTILEEVQFIAMHFRKQDEGEEICSEWKFAAAVTDRLCLVAFTLFAIVCTFTILMSAPNFIEGFCIRISKMSTII
uniref:Neurotransmitter-gated ion-channel transmembrane domain-containing protein n=1 Tax=Strix occidentalis caurina TaxID=311401 RepID=A0A8D0EMG9_STROC